MIQRETGQPLDDLVESSGFLRINEGPVFPVMYVRAPYLDERGNTRGYIVAPLSNSYGQVKVLKQYSPIASFAALPPP